MKSTAQVKEAIDQQALVRSVLKPIVLPKECSQKVNPGLKKGTDSVEVIAGKLDIALYTANNRIVDCNTLTRRAEAARFRKAK